MKRGSANMWWIIIGAVIALVVMIILMVMFTTKSTKLEGGLSACDSKGGYCVPGTTVSVGPPSPGTGCSKKTLTATAFDCKQGYVCCLGSPKSYNSADVDCGTPITDSTGKQWCSSG